MIKTIMKGIKLNKAEKLMKKINSEIDKSLSNDWKCFINHQTTTSLAIRYKSYKNWKEEDLVIILKIINAVCTKHNLSMYFYNSMYRLEIGIDIL